MTACPYDLVIGLDRADQKADLWAAAYYLQQRTKGSSHHSAVRALAFKWQRVIWHCWQDRRPYDEAVYQAALRKNGSDLVKLFDRVELGKSPWKNPAKKN